MAQKIQSNAYTSLDEMVKDLNLIVTNAKTFNEPGSQVYKVCVCVCGGGTRDLPRLMLTRFDTCVTDVTNNTSLT